MSASQNSSRDPYRTEPPPRDNTGGWIVFWVVVALLGGAFWVYKSFGG